MTNRIVRGNLLHRPVRTALTSMAIALEVAMILLILGASDGLLEESTTRKQGLGADILIRPSSSSDVVTTGTAGLSGKLISQLEAWPETKVVTGTTILMQGNLLTVTGVDLDKIAAMAGGIRYLSGGPFEEEFDAIVDDTYARQYKVAVGDTLRLLNRDFRLVGIVEPGKLSRIFVPLETMQRLMGWNGMLSQVYLQLADPSQTEQVIAQLREMLPSNPVYSMDEFISLFETHAREMSRNFVGAIIAIATSVGLIVVLLTMYTAVLERHREISILKSMGASQGYILGIFLRETAWLALSGVLAGALLAYTLRLVIEDRFPLVTVHIFQRHILVAVAVALFGSLLGALYPALRAARQDPVEDLTHG